MALKSLAPDKDFKPKFLDNPIIVGLGNPHNRIEGRQFYRIFRRRNGFCTSRKVNFHVGIEYEPVNNEMRP
jgi:hypothetical protein